MGFPATTRRSVLGYGAAMLGAGASARPSRLLAADGTVTMWSPIAAQATTRPVYNRLQEIYEQDNPGSRLDVVSVGWSPMRDKVFAAVRSKSGPDLVDFQTEQMPSYAPLGGFQAIDDRFAASGLESQVWDITRDYSSFDGNMYSVPWGLDLAMGILYYREDMLEKAGVQKAPETLDELVTTAAALTSGRQWGLAFSGVPGDAMHGGFIDILYSYGGKIFQEKDGKTVIGIATPEARAALQFYVDMLITDKIAHPNSPSFNSDQMRTALIRGEVAMVPSAFRHWASSFRPLAQPLIEQGVLRAVPWPAGPQGRRLKLLAMGYHVTAFDETDADASWKLIETVLRPDVLRELALGAGWGPIVKSVWDEPEYQDLEVVLVLRDIIENYAAPFDSHPLQVPVARGVMERMVSKAISGEMGVDDALDEAQKQADLMLAAYENSTN